MILKCPNCGGYLEYDAATHQMLCPYCSSSFDVREFDTVSSDGADGADGPDASGSRDPGQDNAKGSGWDASDETMDTEIYTCTTCGAELMINHVETATFCAYCGQPTIVFSRIARMKKPDYIVPFTITKEQAHNIIRSSFRSGQYIPESVKDFKPELIRGIYVPFMLYDVKYFDRQLIRSVHRHGKSSTTYYYYREGGHHFANITVDSSFSFNDESSQRLEPYDLTNMQPFHINYLSGYYADCMDDDTAKLEQTAIARSKTLFDEAMLKTVSGSSKTILDNNPCASVTGSQYVMLPVWFVVFNEENMHHTIIVNGQTGKMVGAVPCDQKKVKKALGILCTICSILCTLCLFLFCGGAKAPFGDLIEMYGIVGVAIAALIYYIKVQYDSYKTSQKLTTASLIKHLAADRQEK